MLEDSSNPAHFASFRSKQRTGDELKKIWVTILQLFFSSYLIFENFGYEEGARGKSGELKKKKKGNNYNQMPLNGKLTDLHQ